MNIEMTEIGMERLCNAIIIQAAKDYRNALCGIGEDPEKMHSDCARFFKGNVIAMYTKLDGPTLMKKLYDEVKDCDFDSKLVYKIRSNDDNYLD